MKNNVIVKETRYQSKFIAMPSFEDKTVIAYGKDATKVFRRARGKGVSVPVIIYVPRQNEVNFF